MLTIETARALLQPSRYKGAWVGKGSDKPHFMAGAVVEYCLPNPWRARGVHPRGAEDAGADYVGLGPEHELVAALRRCLQPDGDCL